MIARKSKNNRITVSFSKRHALYIVLAVTLIIAVIGGSYAYDHRGTNAEQEARAVTAKVNKLTTLPDKERPALATITDPSKLGHQKFFADSKEGDKVLIYSENKKVILYRPSTNKIINVGPVTIDELDESVAEKP